MDKVKVEKPEKEAILEVLGKCLKYFLLEGEPVYYLEMTSETNTEIPEIQKDQERFHDG